MKSIQVLVSEETESLLPSIASATKKACEINQRLLEADERRAEEHYQACDSEDCRRLIESYLTDKRKVVEMIEANSKILHDMKNQIAIANQKAARDAK